MLVSGVGVTLIIILLFSCFFFSIFVSFLMCRLCYSVLCLFPHMFPFCFVLLPFFLLVVESDLVFFFFLFSVPVNTGFGQVFVKTPHRRAEVETHVGMAGVRVRSCV